MTVDPTTWNLNIEGSDCAGVVGNHSVLKVDSPEGGGSGSKEETNGAAGALTKGVGPVLEPSHVGPGDSGTVPSEDGTGVVL
ncbi:hypothetical protein AXG93_3217s1230 [Marchantia polymorpha subsp. ruderalis]|uniref:Uncharacterized protein n=1 Tax=Marchantia polymorpha subsp. ruderalis TaxID=1480154 RepID=A0A176VWH6_MARPO|nr:hypothetical protein AXG93_3217s1230 [Marchantia polymorpha subsp. ruderalis]